MSKIFLGRIIAPTGLCLWSNDPFISVDRETDRVNSINTIKAEINRPDALTHYDIYGSLINKMRWEIGYIQHPVLNPEVLNVVEITYHPATREWTFNMMCFDPICLYLYNSMSSLVKEIEKYNNKKKIE